MITKKSDLRSEALEYHAQGRPGKIEVIPTKPYNTQKDLSLAYSPGVAAPCLEIEKQPEDAYKYTAKGNLVAVISNGTAVLGLGDIGAMAGKPVMEGKGLLFKTFADIDVFDIEVDTSNIDEFIQTVRNISPTFGGINLEDIKAPECFEIEERLKQELDIPVMHDDQHGTAIISSAALLNALEIAGKKIEEITVVVNGAGAAAIACTKLYINLGVRPQNIVMCDSKGAITTRRTDLNRIKAQYATERNVSTLEDALKGADVFLGLSVAGVLTSKMVQSMASSPIVFALANPDPEIGYDEAMASRPDIIFATGRSDYPNQVNNVLGFPYIFRGALDVRATKINEEMKVAAVYALARIAKEPVPDVVATAYNNPGLSFGRDYIIPKPLDPRLISAISMAVAKSAIDSGVARKTINDWDAYAFHLEERLGRNNELMRMLRNKARTGAMRRIVFSDGENVNTLKAASTVYSDRMAYPIVLGNKKKIAALMSEYNLELDEKHILDFRCDSMVAKRAKYARVLYEKLNRDGISMHEAARRMEHPNWFALMMVYCKDADTTLVSYEGRYTTALEPYRMLFGKDEKYAALAIVLTKSGPLFFADVGYTSNPTAGQLADIAVLAGNGISKLGIAPVIAMLSYSNFGGSADEDAVKVREAVKILHKNHPEIVVDGEIKADYALDKKARMEKFPFSKLGDKDVNTFVFPDLSAANIAYRLIEKLGHNVEVITPVLLGSSFGHMVPADASARQILNIATIAAIDVAQEGGGK